jgi:hypothetical protein
MRGNPAVLPIATQGDTMLWATASTTNATSYFHLDDYGMATVVYVESGMKLWIVARPKVGLEEKAFRNFGAAHSFEHWDPHSAADNFFDHEAVLLTAGDTLSVAKFHLIFILYC